MTQLQDCLFESEFEKLDLNCLKSIFQGCGNAQHSEGCHTQTEA